MSGLPTTLLSTIYVTQGLSTIGGQNTSSIQGVSTIVGNLADSPVFDGGVPKYAISTVSQASGPTIDDLVSTGKLVLASGNTIPNQTLTLAGANFMSEYPAGSLIRVANTSTDTSLSTLVQSSGAGTYFTRVIAPAQVCSFLWDGSNVIAFDA
jgi:hypothetical protein